MSDDDQAIVDLHAELIVVLNKSDACLSYKLTALAVTAGMAIMSRGGPVTQHFRVAAAVHEEVIAVLANQIDKAAAGGDPIDQIKSGLRDIGAMRGKSDPMN